MKLPITRPATAASLLAALCATFCASAEQLNVSKIAIGLQQDINWALDPTNPIDNSASTYTYFTMATGKVSGEMTSYFDPGPWSAAWLTQPGAPKVDRKTVNQPFTSGGTQYVFSSSYAQEAKADNTVATPSVMADAFGTSLADTASSYTVRVQHTGPSKGYFINLEHPLFKRTITSAYSLNGLDYSYSKPQHAQSHMSVQILVDGLPVWSSEDAQVFPSQFAQWPWEQVQTLWGKQVPAGNSQLFLGTLSAGQSMEITMIVRTTSDVVHPQGYCSYNYMSGYPVTIRCHQDIETVQTPKLPESTLAMSVYAKNVQLLIHWPIPIITLP